MHKHNAQRVSKRWNIALHSNDVQVRTRNEAGSRCDLIVPLGTACLAREKKKNKIVRCVAETIEPAVFDYEKIIRDVAVTIDAATFDYDKIMRGVDVAFDPATFD